MSGQFTSPAVVLRTLAATVAGLLKRQNAAQQIRVIWRDGAETITIPMGWKPLAVDLKSGDPQEDGSGYEYTAASDGFQWTITFNVAPIVRVRIWIERDV